MRTAIALSLALGAGCVSLPPGSVEEPSGRITRASFADLDPGAKTVTSLHFEVRAYASGQGQAFSQLAESCYERIMRDTGLYSFMPRGLYPIVVYASREEYLRKTGMPDWSAGAASGNSIYLFEGPGAAPILAHEMTHLIFNEYMRRSAQESLWVNEGLAVYEEEQASPGTSRRLLPEQTPMPFTQMAAAVPLQREGIFADAWYRQASSVVRFLIEQGGRVGFGQFLSALRDGRTPDEAVRAGFPGQWSSMDSLEASWRKAAR
jgi:hypothetical protein